MESATAFAQMPATPEPIIAQVRRQLSDAAAGGKVDAAALDHLAEAAVRELWDRPVKHFVPVLALRDARERLDAQQP